MQPEIDRHDDGGRIIEYKPEISLTESWGGKARLLWEDRFKELAPIFADAEIVYTGLGGGIGKNADIFVRQHGDGCITPPYLDLQKTFGRVPKVLFLPASITNSDQLLGLRGIARNYKEQGVQNIITVLTSLVHERQDHQFVDNNGNPINEVTMLKEVVENLSQSVIDGGMLVQPHSLRSIEIALRNNFPFIPIDAFPFLIDRANLRNIQHPFVLGPDKGRKDEARILASMLNCPLGSATKTRARLVDGTPEVIIPDDVLKYIQQNKSTVIVLDDEIREGGTIGGLAHALNGYAKEMVVCIVKPIFAPLQNHNATAVTHLQHPLISKVIVTDAVKPFTEPTPIQDKLEVISIGPEIERLINYLKHTIIQPGNPNWLRDPIQAGTLLRLDLSIEHIS